MMNNNLTPEMALILIGQYMTNKRVELYRAICCVKDAADGWIGDDEVSEARLENSKRASDTIPRQVKYFEGVQEKILNAPGKDLTEVLTEGELGEVRMIPLLLTLPG